MKRYSEYKDSGVKWIGEIPGHWKICRTRYLCNINTGDKDTVMKEDNGKYPFYVRSPKIERINTFSYDGEAILMAGDGVGAGKVFHYANGKFDYHQRVYNMHNICGVSGKFMFYFIRDQFHYAMEEKNAKSTVDSVRLPWLKAFPIAIPAQEEQEAIVTYLDTKAAKIDEYISIAEKKIAALEELKQTIIAEAVTRGIHKDVPMKDSGVKWIGMIPAHWEIMRLRFVCEFRNGYTPSKANPKFWENGTIPWFRMEDIRDSGRFLNEAKQYISKEAVKGDGLFEAGSFILATTATIGEHAMLIADSLANQRFTNLKIRKSLISTLSRNFFFYYLFVIDEYCKSTTRKATFPSVDMTELKNIGVSIPPIEEQQEIVTYIEAKAAKIDQLCQAERSQIEKLKEYKQRLISDVVTGKVKVTND